MTVLDSRSAGVLAVGGERSPAYVWLFLAGLAFNVFSGNAGLLGLPLGLDRPLFLFAGALALLDARTPRLVARPVFFVMAVDVAWTSWSWATTGSLADTTKAFALADRVVVPFLMFALGAVIFSSRHSRELLLRFAALMGLYFGITAIGELAQIRVLVFPSYILDPSLGIQFGRARGPFLLSEAMGMSSALCGAMAMLLAYRHVGGWRWVALASAVLSGVAVLLCLTRSVWVATVVAALLVACVVPALRRRAPLTSVGIGVLLVGLFSFDNPLRALVEDRLGNERSVFDRLITNDAALRIIDNDPVFGIGWGNFVGQSAIWVRQAGDYPLTNTGIEVHNVFLARAAETGVFGAVLWGMAMLLGPISAVLARTTSPEAKQWQVLAMVAVVIWVFPSLLSPNNYPFPNNLVWLIGGIASGGLLTVRVGRPLDASDST